jgi:hypothetical protein
LKTSREIIEKIRKRDLYKFAAETIIESGNKIDKERMQQDIVSYSDNDGMNKLEMGDFEILQGTNNYAFKDKNPVDCVKFYNKNNVKSNTNGLALTFLESFKIDPDQVSLLLPSKFSERFVRIYVKSEDKVKVAKDAFNRYCKE